MEQADAVQPVEQPRHILAFLPEVGPAFYWGGGDGASQFTNTQAFVVVDGEAGTPMTEWDGNPASPDWGSCHVTALPYQLGKAGRVGIVGVGGGRDILAAIWSRSPSNTAVEINGNVVALLTEHSRRFTKIAHHPGVTLVHDEGRAYLTRSRGQVDVLLMSSIRGRPPAPAPSRSASTGSTPARRGRSSSTASRPAASSACPAGSRRDRRRRRAASSRLPSARSSNRGAAHGFLLPPTAPALCSRAMNRRSRGCGGANGMAAAVASIAAVMISMMLGIDANLWAAVVCHAVLPLVGAGVATLQPAGTHASDRGPHAPASGPATPGATRA